MTAFMLLIIALLILGGVIAYRTASTSSLQGALLERRLVYRLVELLTTFVVFGIAVAHAPNLFIALIPVMVLPVYFAIVFIAKRLRRHANSKNQQRDGGVVEELTEAGLSACIDTMVTDSLILLAATIAANAPQLNFGFGESDMLLIHGLLVASTSLLIIFVSHSLLLYWRNPGERVDTNQAVLRLQQRLRKPPTIR